MSRPRPIPRSRRPYRYRPRPKPVNVLRWTISEDGALCIMPDGREICQDNPAGRALYNSRVEAMVQRQNFRCSLCPKRLTLSEATFEHSAGRGNGGAHRDDRISDEKGEWLNSACHWFCNRKKGSKRAA